MSMVVSVLLLVLVVLLMVTGIGGGGQSKDCTLVHTHVSPTTKCQLQENSRTLHHFVTSFLFFYSLTHFSHMSKVMLEHRLQSIRSIPELKSSIGFIGLFSQTGK